MYVQPEMATATPNGYVGPYYAAPSVPSQMYYQDMYMHQQAQQTAPDGISIFHKFSLFILLYYSSSPSHVDSSAYRIPEHAKLPRKCRSSQVSYL